MSEYYPWVSINAIPLGKYFAFLCTIAPMTTHHTDEKKPPALVDRWNAWKEARAAQAQQDRGEWGYIPPGCVFVPKRWLYVTQLCLLVILLSNTFIMSVQIYQFLQSRSQATKVVAIAPHTAAASAAR